MLDALFGGSAAWFAVPALVGTLFFVLRLVLMLIGVGVDHDTGDGGLLGAGHDADAPVGYPHDHHGDPATLFKFITVQSALLFAMGFGWTAYGFLRGTSAGFGPSALLGVVGGVGMVALFTKLLHATRRLEQSGTFDIAGTVGAEGQVYVTVPEPGRGRGQVRVVVGQRERILNAVSASGELRPSSRVRVLRISDDRSLVVEAM